MLTRCLKDAKNAKTSNTCFFKGFNSIWQVFLLTTSILLELRIAQIIKKKNMLKGNAGSLNKTYEVAFPIGYIL